MGAFLSGGVDSSLVVALMQAVCDRAVRTYSIGFNDAACDEAPHARASAEHLGTEHTELYVRPEEGLEIIPRLPALYDEPFADSSQIPTCLVAELTRHHVTVALSGDGGDELFGGYNRHVLVPAIQRRAAALPHSVRSVLAGAVRGAAWMAPGWLLRALGSGDTTEKLYKVAGVIAARDASAAYTGLVSHWNDPGILMADDDGDAVSPWAAVAMPQLEDMAQRMMYLDAMTYLPDDILVKVDRAAMGVSLETRVPFLDPEVVRLAWRIPQSLKIHQGRGKWILRRVLSHYVPEHLFERPKAGFSVPLASWLRGPLRDWAEALLDERRLAEEGFFDHRMIRQAWQRLLQGHGSWQHRLWGVLMFQAWLEAR
jgi:asparagine synthase (glutamine-hydrolysing)